MINKIKKSIHNNKIIFWNILLLWILQIFGYIIPLITLPYVLRIIWVEKYWIIAFATAFCGYFILIINYGFNLSATKEISDNKENNLKISEIFSNIIFIKLIIWFFSFIIYLILVFNFKIFYDNYLVFLFISLTFFWEIFSPLWIYQWMEKMKYIVKISIIFQIISLILIFLVIKNISDYIYLPIIYGTISLLSWIVLLILSITIFKIKFILPSFQSMKYYLFEWWHVFISTIFISLYTNSTTFILWLLTNNTVVWYYSTAEKLVRAVVWLIWPISQAIFPNISEKLKISKEKTIAFLQKITILVTVFTLLLSLILFFWADLIVKILFWNNFLESVIIIKILAFSPLIIWLSNIFWVLTMIHFGYKKEFSKILILSAIFSLFLSIPLTIIYSANWMAYWVIITESIITLAMYLFLLKKWINLFKLKY